MIYVGGNLGLSGCVSYLFDRKSIISIKKSDELDEEELMLAALEAAEEDLKVENISK